MAIAIFSNFEAMTTMDLVGESVTAKSIVVDPSPDLPAYRRKNKLMLDTASLILTKYDENGEITETYNINAETAITLAQAAQSKADANETRLNDLVIPPDNSSQVATNKADIATNAANIATNASDIATNASDIATNASDIADYNIVIGQNTFQIDTNKNNIATNAAGIAENKQAIEDLVIPPDVSGQVSTNTTNIATNAEGIAENKKAIEDLVIPPDNSSQVATNTASIATNAGNIADNTTDIATNASGIAANKQSIENLVIPPDVSAQVNSNTGRIAILEEHEHEDDGLKPSNDQWNMLNYPLINVGTGGDNDAYAANIADVKRIAGQGPDLDAYAKLDTDVSFHDVSATNLDFKSNDATALIEHNAGKTIEVKVGTTTNVEFKDSGMKLGRDADMNHQNLLNAGDIRFGDNAALIGNSTGNLSLLNLNKITRNDSNDANSVTLGSGFNAYKSNEHKFSTNDDIDLLSIDTSGLHLPNLHEDPKGKTTIHIDSNNQNTLYDNIGQIYFNTIDKDSGEKHRVFITSANGSITFDKTVRSKEGVTSGTATFNTNTDGAAFLDFREKNELKLGANSHIKITVAGKTPLMITGAQLDFSGLSETMKINHDHNIDVVVSNTTNVAFKSNGMKLLAAVDNNGQTTNNAGDIHFKEGKKLFGSAAGNLQLRYVNGLWRGDGNGSNIQFDATNDVRITGDHIRWFHSNGTQYGGISNTGINLRGITKIVGLPKGSDDTDATNIEHIKELIEAHAPSGGGVEFENYINRTADGSHTFYETTATEANAWVSHTNSSKGSITYTFDYSRQGQEVVAGIENRSQRTIIAKLNRRQSTILTVEVPKYAVFTARYVPALDKYVYNIGSWYPTEQRVLKLSDLNYQSNKDPRQVTRNIVNAMPKNTIVIARHESGSGNKDTANANRFISKGDNNLCETEESIAVIIKYDTDRATGFSTSQGGSGRAWSRVLDGKRHAWFTNDTANSFSLAEDIDLDQYPEEQLFLTGDQGMMKSVVDDEGVESLVPIQGYNVPLQEKRIDELEVETELNKSVTHVFQSEERLVYDWPNPENRPTCDIFVLDSTQTITDSHIDVVDDADHSYTGRYNTVGAICVSNGIWSTNSFHNAYKHESENRYVVFSHDSLRWLAIVAKNLHTSIGAQAIESQVTLGERSQLPMSYGNYTINVNFDDINSLEFVPADTKKTYDDVNKQVVIDFNGARPSGRVVLN